MGRVNPQQVRRYPALRRTSSRARRGVLSHNSTVDFMRTGGLPALFAFRDEVIQSLLGQEA
jgi:hypothetical protein